MDLALHLGMTEAALTRSMTELELQGWADYSRRRMLPMRRIEMHLAQIAQQIAAYMGGVKSPKLSDFLFDQSPSEMQQDADLNDDDEPLELEDIADYFGGVVVHKKD